MKKLFPKILFIAAVICVLIFSLLPGSALHNPGKPETNLEFWITENVDDVDFSDYEPRFGLMGGKEYYGSGYIPTTDENGEQVDPEECVIYTVTSYPDYASRKQHITRISITDPAINVYGLTINSTWSEISSTMKKEGFKPKGSGYVKGKVYIDFSSMEIHIRVDVTNIFGFQF